MTEPDFTRLAPVYDRVRAVDERWWEVYALLVREADLRGRRVLDVGCGTGRLATAFAERERARVWGVDPTPAMLEQARARAPSGVGLKEGRAEELPFRDGWFERVTMWLVIHLVDRGRALNEARRVLAPGGRLSIVTFHESQFERHWLSAFFPSLEAIDRARFPTESELVRELGSAGFGRTRSVRVDQPGSLTRVQALEKLEAGHISTFDLLSAEEVASGRKRALHELPESVDDPLIWLLVLADT